MLLTDQQTADLANLQAARMKIAMGQAVAETEYAGQRTVFAKADLPTLDRLIDQLAGRAYGTVRTRM